MRIVETDNFRRDYPDEKFLNIPSMDEETSQYVADAINYAVGPFHPRFWKVVENDYILEPGFEP